MSGSGVSRRDFMQIVGLGGSLDGARAAAATPRSNPASNWSSPTCSRKISWFPGVGVYYASTCTQCASACGIMGRVREGRILKLEGNPNSAISGGKICGLGQAAVQQHYNPDRLTTPMIRQNGSLEAGDLGTGDGALERDAAPPTGRAGACCLTGPTSGHHQMLLRALVEAGGATRSRRLRCALDRGRGLGQPQDVRRR